MLMGLRVLRFKRALARYAAQFCAEAPSVLELSSDHWLCDYALPKEALLSVGVDTTARQIVAQLAAAVELKASVLRCAYFEEISIRAYAEGDNMGEELMTPPAPVYLAMLRDLMGSLRLSAQNPTADLHLRLPGAGATFGCLLEPNTAIWIQPTYGGVAVATKVRDGAMPGGMPHER